MGIVINLPDQEDWRECNLARQSLAWHLKQNNPLLDFKPAIEKEESLIRSFFNKVRDQLPVAA